MDTSVSPTIMDTSINNQNFILNICMFIKKFDLILLLKNSTCNTSLFRMISLMLQAFPISFLGKKMYLISIPYWAFKLTSFIKCFQAHLILGMSDMNKKGSKSSFICLVLRLVYLDFSDFLFPTTFGRIVIIRIYGFCM